jgi:hypothetical protein
MAFDHSLRFPYSTSSSSRDVTTTDGVTTTALVEITLYRVLYIRLLSIFVVAVPLVCLFGLGISLPASRSALRRNTVDWKRRGSAGARCLVQQLHQAGRSGPSGQLNDVLNIVTTLALLLFMAYLPQVRISVIALFDVASVFSSFSFTSVALSPHSMKGPF